MEELVAPLGYGYLADLAAANGWALALALVDGGEWRALRVFDRRPIREARVLFSARFPAELPLDDAADYVFEQLHERGLA